MRMNQEVAQAWVRHGIIHALNKTGATGAYCDYDPSFRGTVVICDKPISASVRSDLTAAAADYGISLSFRAPFPIRQATRKNIRARIAHGVG